MTYGKPTDYDDRLRLKAATAKEFPGTHDKTISAALEIIGDQDTRGLGKVVNQDDFPHSKLVAGAICTQLWKKYQQGKDKVSAYLSEMFLRRSMELLYQG